MADSVRVPPALTPLFDRAETLVADRFARIERNPATGTVRVDGERYVMVRAASLATGFLNAMQGLLGEQEALRFWYRVAHTLGREDARAFALQTQAATPEERLAYGPVHFAYAGWARVEIDPRSRPSVDDDFYLEYTHPHTFEAEATLQRGAPVERPVCVFSAGYSAGWGSESYGLELDAREVSCLAAGGRECRFVMAPWYRLDGYAAQLVGGRLDKRPTAR